MALNNELSRRQALFSGLAGFAAAGLAETKAFAESAPKTAALPNPPAYYNFAHGDVQITMVSDGPIGLGDPSKLIREATAAEIAARLEAAFLQPDAVVIRQNIPILKIGGKTVIVDTGTGFTTMFGGTTGRLPSNLKAAGIDATQVDVVVLTHCHPDHLGGIVTADGKPAFPNAEIVVNEADFNYWTDEAKLSGDLKIYIEYARSRLMPNKDRLRFIKGGQDAVAGLQAVDAPGHTVGHTIFMLTSGSKPLAITADCAHHYVLFVEQPTIEFAYDTDSKQAVATRLKVWDMLATDRIPFLAYHFPWPGLGHLSRSGDAYRFFQTPMEL